MKKLACLFPLTLALMLCAGLVPAGAAEPAPAAFAPALAPAVCAPTLTLAEPAQAPMPADLFLPDPLLTAPPGGGCEPVCLTPRCSKNSHCADWGGTCIMVCPTAGCCSYPDPGA